MALIGLLLEKTRIGERLNQTRLDGMGTPEISNWDIAHAYIGLLCQGKTDFDHIEPFREDDYFLDALQIQSVPSSPTLRQRIDMAAGKSGWESILLEESAKLLKTLEVTLRPIVLGQDSDHRFYVPLDIDVSPFDNSGTKKEGVSRTYKGLDGYAPIFAYLGQEGYAVHVQLREGSTHVQKGTAAFLRESIGYARQVTDLPLLVRMDAGNDSAENIAICQAEDSKADFIIKRNLRKESVDAWLITAQQHGTCEEPRPGKKVYQGSLLCPVKSVSQPVRMVFEVIERTTTADGQMLLVPEIEVSAYWTSLPDAPAVIIQLYREHAVMEQFHSEIKTDLDAERLPSGKFATNSLVLHFVVVAYNLLRVIGQESLKRGDSPLRKKVERRRIRTVIQNLMTLAAKMVRHARQTKLKLGRGNQWLPTFRRLYLTFS
ncbi:IS1380 family transposase [Alicyclobacillus cycloheptanicus]|uniref:IS1380 family transposase n=1 Tax=Alicyclobacillus cycloheptanicus TaxID=1457 RepID=UPI002378BE92|nr:IS1380 family transposase [Alicyclobacillus cycloheptanicus]WDM02985.1 IS1380 family transposase [Alicyclobacillus cycloheptanicus]